MLGTRVIIAKKPTPTVAALAKGWESRKWRKRAIDMLKNRNMETYRKYFTLRRFERRRLGPANGFNVLPKKAKKQ